MSVVRNIICMENDRVSVIRLKPEKMEFLKKDGEIDFPITSDFWSWWKRVVSYIEGDSVDICFVYDKKYDLLSETGINEKNIINSSESVWKIEYIKNYFWELKPTYLKLLLIGPNNQECILTGNKEDSLRRFCTNLDFSEADIEMESSSNEDIDEETNVVNEAECSEFAQYFIDMIKRERG